MPGDSLKRAAEFHKLAAHAHEAAAASHDKGDHLSAHESARLGLEHATKAFAHSQDAERKSADLAREANK